MALLSIVIAAVFGGRAIDWLAAHATSTAGGTAASASAQPVVGMNWLMALATFGAAMMPVMWCYEGTTDSAKMTEEIRDPRRAMPRALIGTAVLVTGLYLLLNWAFLRVLTPAEMASSNFDAADVLGHWWRNGRTITLLLSIGVVL